MICIIAGNYREAFQFARGQFWRDDEWFYPRDFDELMQRSNFHILVIGTAGENVPASYFNKLLALAQERGRMK